MPLTLATSPGCCEIVVPRLYLLYIDNCPSTSTGLYRHHLQRPASAGLTSSMTPLLSDGQHDFAGLSYLPIYHNWAYPCFHLHKQGKRFPGPTARTPDISIIVKHTLMVSINVTIQAMAISHWFPSTLLLPLMTPLMIG
jgi:hypothetical protein